MRNSLHGMRRDNSMVGGAYHSAGLRHSDAAIFGETGLVQHLWGEVHTVKYVPGVVI